MNINATFPCRFLLSLDSRKDRRERLAMRFAEVGMTAEWHPALPAAQIGQELHGFANARKRACALTKRFALRSAERRKADAVLLLEDDIVFHPDFAARVAALELPQDWGLFYFGCQHCEPPSETGPGILRTYRALDNHAVAVRRPYFSVVRARIRGRGPRGRGRFASDQLLSDLHHTIPTYAAYPNLIWQEPGWSDVALCHYGNYTPRGEQKMWKQAVKHLEYPSHSASVV